MPPLDREIATFNAKLPELLADVGKFVLIKDDRIEGKFETYADALKAGYESHRAGEFLVKKIAPAEQVAFFTRDLVFECRQ
ncbi:hypothetical protein [Methylobacterium gossipiicola]|nr:hypothetical protein [Methylobacterium gossipiicola]